VTLLPTEEVGAAVEDKIARLDVRVELESGAQVDVEMQNTKRRDQPKRALFYWAKTYVSGLRRGQR